MTKEAVVLAGGLGTRLARVLDDVPKVMAPIGQRPFLACLLDYLCHEGFTHVVISVRRLHEKITDFFGHVYHSLQIGYACEDSPMGTGGATLLALNQCTHDQVFVMNGDTLFRICTDDLHRRHSEAGAHISLAMRHVPDASRYGMIAIGPHNVIGAFGKKQSESRPGWINGGICLVDRRWLTHEPLPRQFSLERDLFPRLAGKMYGFPYSACFIDIGIPEDYIRAQHELG